MGLGNTTSVIQMPTNNDHPHTVRMLLMVKYIIGKTATPIIRIRRDGSSVSPLALNPAGLTPPPLAGQ